MSILNNVDMHIVDFYKESMKKIDSISILALVSIII